MKILVFFFLLIAARPLFGQGEVPVPDSGTIWLDDNGTIVGEGEGRFRIQFRFRRVDGVKTLFYTREDCEPLLFVALLSIGLSPRIPTKCEPLTDESPNDFSLFQEKKMELLNWADGLPVKIVSKATTSSPRALSTQQPMAPPAPSIIILDGLSGDVLRFDLLTGTVVNRVSPPQTAQGPMATRPSGQLVDDEVWIANGSSQVWVLNMATQTVVANVATPSVPALALPAGIVFTNNGATAIEPFQFLSPDAAGNSGVLVVIDAAARKVTSTLPLKFGVATVVMAPDGLTAYLLSQNGQLTYYDVLSGTADLSVSTYAPGSRGGYNGVSNVFIHPDGTRLFWAVGPYLETFDLTRRKVTAEFDSGLPTTSVIALEVSQDGKTATLSNALGGVVVMETHYGTMQYNLKYDSAVQVFSNN